LREAERKFVIEGPRAVESALISGVEVEAVYFEPSSSETASKVLEMAAEIGYRTYETVPGVLERAADAVSPQSVAAIASFVDVDISQIDPDSYIVVMAGVRDPGNAGTLIRSSLAAGAAAVILCDQCVDIYNPKTVRSSAGALFSVPIVIMDTLAQVKSYLSSRGYKLIGTSSHGKTPYWDVDLAGKVAIVLGNEGSGLDASHGDLFDEFVTIPINPAAESLNVGVAGSIILFEAMRQAAASPR